MSDQDELISAVGVDYTRLRDLLANGQWQEADRETSAVMLKVADQEKEGWLDTGDIENFPCEDLRTIDQLWVKYSDGCFGFSVQKRIYEEELNIYYKLAERIGWTSRTSYAYRDYNTLTFDLGCPEGQLPAWIFWGQRISIHRGSRRLSFIIHALLWHRARNCNL